MPRGSVMVGTRTRLSRLVVARQRLQVLDPRLTEGFRIRHDVGLADLDEIGSVEHAADPHLQLQRPTPRLSLFSGEHGPLFVVQVHLRSSPCGAIPLILRHGKVLLAGTDMVY